VAAIDVGTGASASVPTCSTAGCDRPRWSVKRRGTSITVSNFCLEHSQPAMFEIPVEPAKMKAKPAPRHKGLSQFATEVRRQRLEREKNA
jgi:hypothetical protein